MLRLVFLLLLMVPGIARADDQIVGVWVNADQSLRLDILDGFKPNRGAVLAIENGTETDIGSWETRTSATTMQIGWRSSPVTFLAPDTFEWNHKAFKKQREIDEKDVLSLKQDKTGFVEKLTGTEWLTSTEGKRSIFKSTFSTDSGVVETLSKDGTLDALYSWGIASGILKIGSTVVIESRASENYLIGLNENDKFLIFRAVGSVNVESRADLAGQRAEFLGLLVTDAWQKVYYDGFRDYRFRPVEGPLMGRRLSFKDDRLETFSTWEYSPSTGALKIGRTEYIGGLMIGNTLALMEKDGEQTFYKRKQGGKGKSFSVADVHSHRINETKGSDLALILSGQFQKESYLYLFEFGEDNRTGFVHQWRSFPFTITGQKLATGLFREAAIVHEVEDVVLFDGRFALKRDATASRLRAKTDREILEDKENMEERLQELGQKTLILRVVDVGGDAHDIRLPFSSMKDVSEIQILQR